MVIEMPRVSIIVPFYNNREWIFDTVQSICNQNYENIELILVDDGSNDGSSECITRFVNSIDWVTLYTTNQVGLSKARNIALKKITGEYVMFVDGDDMLAENAVNKLIDVVRENEPDFVAFSFFKLMKKTKKKSV